MRESEPDIAERILDHRVEEPDYAGNQAKETIRISKRQLAGRLALVGDAKNWREVAACKDMDLDIFFPKTENDEDTIALSKRICASCRVGEQCLEYARQTRQEFGTWGGQTQWERLFKKPRKKRKPQS